MTRNFLLILTFLTILHTKSVFAEQVCKMNFEAVVSWHIYDPDLTGLEQIYKNKNFNQCKAHALFEAIKIGNILAKVEEFAKEDMLEGIVANVDYTKIEKKDGEMIEIEQSESMEIVRPKGSLLFPKNLLPLSAL